MTLTGWSVGGIAGPLLANTFEGQALYLVLAVPHKEGGIRRVAVKCLDMTKNSDCEGSLL